MENDISSHIYFVKNGLVEVSQSHSLLDFIPPLPH